MNVPISAADQIRTQLERVSHLHAQAERAGLTVAVHAIKQLQAQRFRVTYGDFLMDRQRAPATRFFLDELYGEHNFRERDAQFGRIAGALEKLFPEAVAALAVDLAETHALTETLDHEMALHWLALGEQADKAERYVRSWRLTGAREKRERQLSVVQHMGLELQQLTRSRSLLLALKMMRRPAQAAGLSSLQHFLENGFAAFGTLGDARAFLATIAERERRWLDLLFDAEPEMARRALERELAQP
jgi:hypothetical protein